ncbi:MAG TPA: class I SAM-dependent methyltransferase [Fimbriimonadaceae bacterium]|nr:class I SAM-dependent methyltransferase [Fimbriimonadaceae bacterium]
MQNKKELTADKIYSYLHDDGVPAWPGEIGFYKELAQTCCRKGGAILDIACGADRVCIPLAEAGYRVVAFDYSPKMADEAKRRGAHLEGLAVSQGDMREFEFSGPFELALIPGHSFQFMITAEDQRRALACIFRHLAPGGVLCIHVSATDPRWIADQMTRSEPETVGKVRYIEALGIHVRRFHRWDYSIPDEIATCTMGWDHLDDAGTVVDRYALEPMRLWCVSRRALEHALHMVGFRDIQLFANFDRAPFEGEPQDMVWLASKPLDS